MQDPSGTVAIVDDDANMRAAIQAVLCAAGMRVRTFQSAEAFLQDQPSGGLACAVLDVWMPEITGLDLQRELLTRDPTLGIVFITGAGDISMSVQAMKRGAVEFLTKPFSDRALLDAVGEAVRKTAQLRAERDARAAILARYEGLTRRERDVFECVVRGLPNKLTAHELGISEVTVKIHRGHLMAKMQAGSMAELVRMVEHIRTPPKT